VGRCYLSLSYCLFFIVVVQRAGAFSYPSIPTRLTHTSNQMLTSQALPIGSTWPGCVATSMIIGWDGKPLGTAKG